MAPGRKFPGTDGLAALGSDRGAARLTRRPWRSMRAPALVASHSAALLRAPDAVTSPVLQVMLERAREGSRPGARRDGHVVCLAVEGGGMRGAVSAGMCVVLEAAGLVPAIDRVYGVSAGALNGCATAAGQAALSATYYHDAASRGVINRMRPLVGRPVIDLDVLFDEVIAARKPLSISRSASGPEFRALATSLDTLSLRVLEGFADSDELMQAVRVSAALPRLGGTVPEFRGERMIDGGFIEPIPYRTPLAQGATHVLVLRSRPASYRKPMLSELGESMVLRDEPALQELLSARHSVYNVHAAELERAAGGELGGAQLLQVAVPDGTRLIGRLDPNLARITEALRLGAMAMASMVLTDPIDLCWQPVVYRAEPAEPLPVPADGVACADAADGIDPVRDALKRHAP